MKMAVFIRSTFCAIVLFAAAMTAAAENVVSICAQINASGNIRIDQPEALLRLLEYTPAAIVPENGENAAEHHRTATSVRTGYRVQVFDDNNPRTARTEAQNRKRMMESRFPEWHAYLQFNSPYWRVKVGDFRSRGEAEGAIEDMRRAFPYMSGQLRIVRDRINIAD